MSINSQVKTYMTVALVNFHGKQSTVISLLNIPFGPEANLPAVGSLCISILYMQSMYDQNSRVCTIIISSLYRDEFVHIETLVRHGSTSPSEFIHCVQIMLLFFFKKKVYLHGIFFFGKKISKNRYYYIGLSKYQLLDYKDGWLDASATFSNFKK